MMCLHRQGIVLELLERLPEALDAFEETLQIHRDLYGTNNKLDLASHLQDAGMVLKKLGCFEEARIRFVEALALCKEENELGEDLIFALKPLGALLSDMGYLEEALSHLEEAISLSKKLPSPDTQSELVITILSEQCRVLAGLNRLTEALDISEELLQQQRSRSDSEPNPELISFLGRSGGILYALKRYRESAEKYEHALEVQRRLDGQNETLMKAYLLNRLGEALQSCNELPSALKHHQDALQILENIYGTNPLPNYDVGITLNYLTIVLAKLNRTEEAIDFHIKASEIANALHIPGIHPVKAVTLNNTVLSSQQSPLQKMLLDTSLQLLKLYGIPPNIIIQRYACKRYLMI